jgi:tetratricopeptide (TPR) repeat protein
VKIGTPKAVTMITDQIKKNPENAQLYYNRAQAYTALGNDSNAIKDAFKALAIDSTKAEYFKLAGDILHKNKAYSACVGYYLKSCKLDPTDNEYQYKLANMYFILKEYTKAMYHIGLVLRTDPYHYDAHFLKGMLHADMKDTAAAIRAFQSTAQINPEKQDAYLQLAFLTSERDINQAKLYFMNAFKTDTLNMEPLNGIGLLHQNRGEIEEAKKIFTDIILRDMTYEKAYYNMGCMLMDQDSLEKAIRQFGYAIKNKPNYVEAYFNRGLCNERLNKKEEAIADYTSCTRLDSSYISAIEGLKRIN